MKREYIAIAILVTVVASVLLSGCTSGPATNVTASPTLKPTLVNKTMADLGQDVGAAAAAVGANATQPVVGTPWPEMKSGNNTSILNTSAGMVEVLTNQTNATPQSVPPK